MIFGKHINKFYGKYLLFFLIGGITLVAIDFSQLNIPEIIGIIIDGIKDNTITNDLLLTSIWKLLGISLFVFFGRFIWRMCFFGAAIRIKADLRRDMFVKLESLSRDYYTENKTGAIMALVTNDLETIGDCFGDGALIFIDSIFMGTLSMIKMITLDKTLFFASFIPIIIIVVVGIFIEKIIDKKYTLKQEAFEKLSDFTQENFSGLSVVKAYVKEKREQERFSLINEENKKHNLGFTMTTLVIDILQEFFLQLVFIMICVVGSILIHSSNSSNLTVGGLTTFVGYFDYLIWPLMAFSYLINMMAQGYASLKRVNKLLNQKPTVIDKDVNNDIEIDGKIEFRHLSFNYGDSPINALNDVSFTINPKEKIGIIGKTGCGKTTIVDLLVRMYNVENDSIFLSDCDIMKIPLKKVRTAISIVPQDNFLFGQTVTKNIAFSQSKFLIPDIYRVSEEADVYKDIIEFQDGFDTLIGERGVMVSGGQKQRISIARSLLKENKILILDDAVSAVDTQTEDMILHNLLTKYPDSTLIVTSHRVSTIKDMDRILVMDEGKVLGFDTHDNLYRDCKLYREMVDLQQLEEKVGGKIDE